MTTLEKLCELQSKATPGPWDQSHRRLKTGMYSTQVYTDDGETVCTMHWYEMPAINGVIGTYREPNAQFVAACGSFDFPALAAEIAQYKADIGKLVIERETLRAALKEIAMQNMVSECETDEYDEPTGDFEVGYDSIILLARRALGEPTSTRRIK